MAKNNSLLARWKAVFASLGRLIVKGTPTQPHSENADVRYEHSDLTSRKVILTGVGILVGTWLIAMVIYVSFAAIQRHTPASTAFTMPPEPRLQTAPRADFAGQRDWEERQLRQYSWADREKGVVNIPIERAMELIVQRGIPPQKAPAELKLPIPAAGTRDTGLQRSIVQESR